ncbi:hypothetical protein ACIBF1_37500 [Spirillospora sp. NPDC050679]
MTKPKPRYQFPGPAGEAIERLSAELRRRGIRVAAGTKISLPEILVGEAKLSVSCHRAPHNGALHICVAGEGPCQVVGTPDDLAEAADALMQAASSPHTDLPAVEREDRPSRPQNATPTTVAPPA